MICFQDLPILNQGYPVHSFLRTVIFCNKNMNTAFMGHHPDVAHSVQWIPLRSSLCGTRGRGSLGHLDVEFWSHLAYASSIAKILSFCRVLIPTSTSCLRVPIPLHQHEPIIARHLNVSLHSWVIWDIALLFEFVSSYFSCSYATFHF